MSDAQRYGRIPGQGQGLGPLEVEISATFKISTVVLHCGIFILPWCQRIFRSMDRQCWTEMAAAPGHSYLPLFWHLQRHRHWAPTFVPTVILKIVRGGAICSTFGFLDRKWIFISPHRLLYMVEEHQADLGHPQQLCWGLGLFSC